MTPCNLEHIGPLLSRSQPSLTRTWPGIAVALDRLWGTTAAASLVSYRLFSVQSSVGKAGSCFLNMRFTSAATCAEGKWGRQVLCEGGVSARGRLRHAPGRLPHRPGPGPVHRQFHFGNQQAGPVEGGRPQWRLTCAILACTIVRRFHLPHSGDLPPGQRGGPRLGVLPAFTAGKETPNRCAMRVWVRPSRARSCRIWSGRSGGMGEFKTVPRELRRNCAVFAP